MKKEYIEATITKNTTFSVQTFKELDFGRIIFFSIITLLGIGALVAFIILLNTDVNKVYAIIIALFAMVFLGFGVMFYIATIKNFYNVKKHKLTAEYRFYLDHVDTYNYKDKRKVDKINIPYQKISKYKLTPNYLFLFTFDRKVISIKRDIDLDKIQKLVDTSNMNKKIF